MICNNEQNIYCSFKTAAPIPHGDSATEMRYATQTVGQWYVATRVFYRIPQPVNDGGAAARICRISQRSDVENTAEMAREAEQVASQA